jgi:hypothetical protein
LPAIHLDDTVEVPSKRLGARERALYQAHFRAKAGVLPDADLIHSLGIMAAIQERKSAQIINLPPAPRRR